MSKLTELVKQLKDVKNEIGSLNNQLKIQQSDRAQLEIDIMHELENLGLTKASTDMGTVYISETTVASVTDWEEVYKYIDEHKAWHLLTRKVVDSVFRELLDMKQEVPGVKPFIRKTIGLRSE